MIEVVEFQIGIRNDSLYGVTIEPRRTVRIGNLDLVSYPSECKHDTGVTTPSEVLIKYAFWNMFTGKMTAKTKVAQKLRYYSLHILAIVCN